MPVLTGLRPAEMHRIRHCQGCRFLGAVGDCGCCNYLIETGQRRPCKFGAGCTVKDIGKRHRSCTINRARKPYKQRDLPWDVALAKQMYEAGISLSKIASTVGKTYEAMRRYARYHNWQRKENAASDAGTSATAER